MDNKAIDIIPILDENIALNYDRSMSPEQKVNYLVQNLRLTLNNHGLLLDATASRALDYKKFPFKKNKYDIEKDDFEGDSTAVVDLLRRLNWEKKGISFRKYDLENLSDFYQDEQSEFKEILKRNRHSISIVTIEDKKYIIDCTYRQFFSGNQIDLSQLCMNNEKRREIAEQMLKRGWIEATPKNIKIYMDMFIEVAAKSKNIDFPTEKEYAENVEGEIVLGDELVRQASEGCHFTKILRRYYIEKRKKEENQEKRKILEKVQSSSVFAFRDEVFCISEKNGRYYIKSGKLFDSDTRTEKLDEETKIELWDIVKKAEDGELEYTDENLKKYLDSFTILVTGEKDIETPSIEEYNETLGIESLKKYGIATDTYVIDSEPVILQDYDYESFDEKMSAEEKLISVVQKERHFIMRNRDIMAESLKGDCEDSTVRILFDCASKGFTDIHYLFPNTYIDKGKVGHNCAIATIDGTSYLIDCTYRQFFTKSNGDKEPRNIYGSR